MNDSSRLNQLIEQGLAASRENRTEVALELFAQASSSAPTSGIPHFLIGSEHASAGRIEAAELSFANAVLLSPEFHLARYQLGLLQFSSQRPAVALLTWQPLFALPDEHALGHFVRGFAALAQDLFDEALAHYHSGLKRSDENPAVKADINRIIASVEQLPRPAAHNSTALPIESHVLISDYSKGLH